VVGASVATTDKDERSAFHFAAEGGHAALVQFFLEHHNRDLHASKALPDGRTPLQLAVRAGSVPAVQALVRFAPVHDVKRCWVGVEEGLAAHADTEAGRKAKEILDVLRTKVAPLVTARRCIKY
jgi:ankyrin repeat protein